MNTTCPRCNGYIDDKQIVCPHCGYELKQSTKRTRQQTEFKTNAFERGRRQSGPNEELPIIFAFIGFFVPIAGIVLYLALNATRPRSASYALKGAFVGIVLSVIAFMFFFTMVIIQPGAPSYT